MKNKIVTLKELIEVVKQNKGQGKKIVSTSGCFDILHAGHVEYLEAAKNMGDILIVMLNSDKSVHGLKGANRPIVNEVDRALVLSGLQAVDYVCLFDERTPCDMIRRIQPDIVVKGGDYAGKHIPEMDTVAVYGGKVEYVLLVEGHSTTDIVKKIEKQYEEQNAR
jgi:D-beta-D-heptose 7-phosphate kinase/D-beta-D-heptose 1-phosphate adenosyltransferase